MDFLRGERSTIFIFISSTYGTFGFVTSSGLRSGLSACFLVCRLVTYLRMDLSLPVYWSAEYQYMIFKVK